MSCKTRDAQLHRLGLEWATAERRGDVSTLERLMCDDFIGIGQHGLTLTKQQWLTRYVAGDLVQISFAWDSLTVHGYDGAAVLTRVPEHGSVDRGLSVDGRFRASLFVDNHGGRPRIAAIQPVRVKRPCRPTALP